MRFKYIEKKNLATVLFGFPLLLGGMFLFIQPNTAHAAGTPCSITPVLTEADLNSCIVEAPTDNSEFDIIIGANFNITAQKTVSAGKNITITSVNPASPATLTRDPGFVGRLLVASAAAPSTANLTIDSVIIDGNNPVATANNQLVVVGSNATATITGNTVIKNNNSTSDGSGIYFSGTNTLNMSGGTISNNTTNRGGGVYIVSGTFNLTGGEISDNTASTVAGGVYLQGGTLNISGNAAISNNTSINAGGLRVQYGAEVNMYGGVISGNSSTGNAGGVGLLSTFNFYGGEITNNTSMGGGGGVRVQGTAATAELNMPLGSTGVISGNTAINGGGVYVVEDVANTFNMASGTISGNTAQQNGGGIYIEDEGTVVITGGEITNNTADIDGGGVFTMDYDLLFVGLGAIFSGNRAASYTLERDPAYDAVYATNILGINWTVPFTQGYNNFDINHDYEAVPGVPGTGGTPFGLGNAIASSLVVFGGTIVFIAIGTISLRRKLAKITLSKM